MGIRGTVAPASWVHTLYETAEGDNTGINVHVINHHSASNVST